MSILFPQQSQDYTLMSGKTNFKSGKSGSEIPEKRTVITIDNDTVLSSAGQHVSWNDTQDAKVYGTQYVLSYIITTGNTLPLRAKSISVRIKSVGSISDLKIDVYKLNSSNEPVTLVKTATIQTAEISSSYAWENVSISDIKLEPNTNYGLVFRQSLDGGDINNYISISANSGVDNKFYLSTDGGDTWNRDANFYIFCNINYYTFEKDIFYIGNDYAYNATVSVFSYEAPDTPVQHDYVQNFIGFSTSSVQPDSNITVQTDGIIEGLKDSSGADLVTGTTYYFAANGKIETTVNLKQIGKAISTDKLLIIRDI